MYVLYKSTNYSCDLTSSEFTMAKLDKPPPSTSNDKDLALHTSDAARELISREFSRMNFKIILENEFSILEKFRERKISGNSPF